MKKGEFIEVMASELNITKATAKRALEKMRDLIVEELMDEGRFHFAGLGVFTRRHREARMVNIAKGAEAGTKKEAPARNTVHFKPALALKTAVNQ
jgi:nucleoid DNA-binding protein